MKGVSRALFAIRNEMVELDIGEPILRIGIGKLDGENALEDSSNHYYEVLGGHCMLTLKTGRE